MVVETWFQANTLKKDSRTRSICNCVAPLLTVRFVKTTDASRHFAACACVCLGNRNELPHFCCIQTLIQARNATSCCSFCFVRNFCKDNCLGYVYFLPSLLSIFLQPFFRGIVERHHVFSPYIIYWFHLTNSFQSLMCHWFISFVHMKHCGNTLAWSNGQNISK